jgi:hypothetical protein
VDADQADKWMRIVAADTMTDAALTFKQRCDDADRIQGRSSRLSNLGCGSSCKPSGDAIEIQVDAALLVVADCLD